MMADANAALSLCTNVHEHNLPTFIVANMYVDEEQYITEHHDQGEIFGFDNPSVIFSLNLKRDALFTLRPQNLDWIRDYLNIPRSRKWHQVEDEWEQRGLLVPVLAPENTCIVMGGWSQAVLQHSTLSHGSVLRAFQAGACADSLVRGVVCPRTTPERAAWCQSVVQSYLQRGLFCTAATPRTAAPSGLLANSV